MLPCPCYRCGRIVTADMKWSADHPVARVHAEAQGVPEHEQDLTVVPSHASCDQKAGAKTGNELRAKPRTEQRKITPIKRKISFSSEALSTPAAALQVFYPNAEMDSQEAQDAS